MKNPWFDIPLSDYEGHMASAHVGQAQLLSDVFAEVLRQYSPRSIAVLGCAGGNGLERVDVTKTERIVCVDINPQYVEQVRARFSPQLPFLECIVGDIQTDEVSFPPVQLAFAGLLFEYVDVDVVLARIQSMLCQNGVLLTLVQLPSPGVPEITPSSFTSLSTLSSTMQLVPPELLTRLAITHGYREIETRTVRAGTGKQFQVQGFRLDTRLPTVSTAMRPATREDVVAMHRIRLAVRENMLTSTAISERDYIPAIESTGRGWVVESGGKIVAFAVGNSRTGNIWALFVDPDHEHQGYGRMLQDETVNWLWSQGFERLWLTTSRDTRAERFYRSAGWREVGRTSGGEIRFELWRKARTMAESSA